MVRRIGVNAVQPLGVSSPTEGEATLGLVRGLIGDPSGWAISEGTTWVNAAPASTVGPAQGWKLHVSATVESFTAVLAAVVPVLARQRVPFKVAATARVVATLTSPREPRSSAGKVIAIYPPTVEVCRALGYELHAATRDLTGTSIPGDRAVAAGSLVHYRYGGFVARRGLTLDGEVVALIQAPDGTDVVDDRAVGAAAPPWTSAPFHRPPTSGTQRGPTQVLIGGRYEVRRAIRHAFRGGVFVAVDRRTGHEVVIKQARRGALGAHGDAVETLRHEAHMLQRLQCTAAVPRFVDLCEQGGDLFLVASRAPGLPMRAWRRALIETSTEAGPALGAAATALAAHVRAIHDVDVVLGDLTPNNVLVEQNSQGDVVRVTIVDLELAGAVGCTRSGPVVGTPGYASPDQLAGAPASYAMDRYALGATWAFLATGEDPVWELSGATSMSDWLARRGRETAVGNRVRAAIAALCGEGPGDCAEATATPTDWSLPSVHVQRSRAARAADPDEPAPLNATIDRTIEGLLARLVEQVDTSAARAVPTSAFGERTLPGCVQHGSGGVLGVLAQAVRLGVAPLPSHQLTSVLADLAQWTREQEVLAGDCVGLLFGEAGVALALAEAGDALGDAELVQHATYRLLAVPRDVPGSDLAQGIGGLVLALLRLRELTGPAEHDQLDAAVRDLCARLAQRAVREGRQLFWPVPPGLASQAAGQLFHGYVHGTAGVVHVLDRAVQVLQDPAVAAMAGEATAGLVAAAHRDGEFAWWTQGPADEGEGKEHLCNGTPGVLAGIGHRCPPELLAAGVRSTRSRQWEHGIAYCHGLAGNLDILLDLAAAGPQQQALAAPAARVLAAQLCSRVTWPDGRATLTDEPLWAGRQPVADFGTGSAGALSALLRLRYGGPRLWTTALVPPRVERR